jgi:hypothetical protein
MALTQLTKKIEAAYKKRMQAAKFELVVSRLLERSELCFIFVCCVLSELRESMFTLLSYRLWGVAGAKAASPV